MGDCSLEAAASAALEAGAFRCATRFFGAGFGVADFPGTIVFGLSKFASAGFGLPTAVGLGRGGRLDVESCGILAGVDSGLLNGNSRFGGINASYMSFRAAVDEEGSLKGSSFGGPRSIGGI